MAPEEPAGSGELYASCIGLGEELHKRSEMHLGDRKKMVEDEEEEGE